MTDETAGKDDAPGPGRLIGRVRKACIADLVRENGFMSPAELSRRFDVSEMTIRRDLAELAMRGEIQRIHGGATSDTRRRTEESGLHRPFAGVTIRDHVALRRIARAALALIRPTQSVALDAGTSAPVLAKELLASDTPVRLFTNNLPIASLPANDGTEVYLLGGRMRANERSLGGPMAIEQVRKLWFDTAFISVSSVVVGGFFDNSLDEAELKRLCIERATRRVFLAHSANYLSMSLIQVAPLNQCDVIVTDAPPPAGLAQALAAAGVQVLVAPA
ncbi:MAG: DeoR/GlpR transcriptional regulator [Alphaproteobacteria bacterium]|nr:DeoR/GlpR transcriptional regulator [Alphaproteobacteria bacterium]